MKKEIPIDDPEYQKYLDYLVEMSEDLSVKDIIILLYRRMTCRE